jgi:multicomponent Na+:H+ antiporter subunit G
MSDDPLALARFAVAGLFAGLGLLTMLTAALGFLRFPDFYARLHAMLAAETVGAGLCLVALAISAWDGQTTLRLLILGVALAAIAPARAHALALAAHGGGLTPIIGRYRAPKPGEERDRP